MHHKDILFQVCRIKAKLGLGKKYKGPPNAKVNGFLETAKLLVVGNSVHNLSSYSSVRKQQRRKGRTFYHEGYYIAYGNMTRLQNLG